MAIETLLAGLSDEVAAVAEHIRSGVVQVKAGRGGIGSGVVWSVAANGTANEAGEASGASEATIITNAHVVGAARNGDLTVRLADDTELPATVTAIDPAHDLAALSVRGKGLHALEIGDSARLRVGELVIAVGNPFGMLGAVTVGVVAARAPIDPDVDAEPADTPFGRPSLWRGRGQEYIHADISLYPGNSGGPLADARGRVVGINAMIGGGLAFAIPSHVVRRFLEEAGATPPRLGVEVLTVPLGPSFRARVGIQQETAALVAGVAPDSPAAAAGIALGDVLLAVDGVAVLGAEQLVRVLRRGARLGQPRTLTIVRGGARLDVALTPAEQAA